MAITSFSRATQLASMADKNSSASR